MTSARASGLALALDDGTRKSHSVAENTAFVTGFFRGIATKSAFSQLVASLYFVYEAMESALVEMEGTIVAGGSSEAKAEKAALEREMEGEREEREAASSKLALMIEAAKEDGGGELAEADLADLSSTMLMLKTQEERVARREAPPHVQQRRVAGRERGLLAEPLELRAGRAGEEGGPAFG